MNLRPPGYEYPDSRLRRRGHSPLPHTVPSQPVQLVSPHLHRLGPSRLQIWLHPRRPPPRPPSLSKVSAVPNHVALMGWLHIYQVHHRSPGRGRRPGALTGRGAGVQGVDSRFGSSPLDPYWGLKIQPTNRNARCRLDSTWLWGRVSELGMVRVYTTTTILGTAIASESMRGRHVLPCSEFLSCPRCEH